MKKSTSRYVNWHRVEKLIKGRSGTYKSFCAEYGISRQRLWQIMSKPHRSADEQCLKRLAAYLGVEVESILKGE